MSSSCPTCGTKPARSWTTADEWMADFLRRASKGRHRIRVLAEGPVVLPRAELAARRYADETASRLAFIRGRELNAELVDRMRAKAARKRAAVPTPDAHVVLDRRAVAHG